MKNKKKHNTNTGPIAVCVPSTKKEKMEAIVALSNAVVELAKALNSTHLVANVSDCNFTSTKGSIGPALQIGGVE